MAEGKRGRSFGGAEAVFEPGTIDQLRLAWRLVRDPRVTSRVKTAVPLIAAAYLLSPIDLVPDFLLGLGQIDDVGVVGVALLVLTRLLPRLAPAAVVDEHRRAMGRAGHFAGGEDVAGGRAVVDAEFRVHDDPRARGR